MHMIKSAILDSIRFFKIAYDRHISNRFVNTSNNRAISCTLADHSECFLNTTFGVSYASQFVILPTFLQSLKEQNMCMLQVYCSAD